MDPFFTEIALLLFIFIAAMTGVIWYWRRQQRQELLDPRRFSRMPPPAAQPRASQPRADKLVDSEPARPVLKPPVPAPAPMAQPTDRKTKTGATHTLQVDHEGGRVLYWVDGIPFGSIQDIPDPRVREEFNALVVLKPWLVQEPTEDNRPAAPAEPPGGSRPPDQVTNAGPALPAVKPAPLPEQPAPPVQTIDLTKMIAEMLRGTEVKSSKFKEQHTLKLEREGERTIYWYDGIPYGRLEDVPNERIRAQAQILLSQNPSLAGTAASGDTPSSPPASPLAETPPPDSNAASSPQAPAPADEPAQPQIHIVINDKTYNSLDEITDPRLRRLAERMLRNKKS